MTIIRLISVSCGHDIVRSDNGKSILLEECECGAAVIHGNSNINLLTEKSWNRDVNRSELMCEVVKMKTATFMRGDGALVKMTRCEAITGIDERSEESNSPERCFR